MKNRFKKFLSSDTLVTIVWLIAVIIIWELAANVVEQTKRTPENILPHTYQLIGSIFSGKMISSNMTAIQIVVTSAGATLTRAGIGFLIGTLAGFILALLMDLSGVIQKIAFPYLMLIQMIPVLGMAPIVLAITHDINKSRIVIAAILTFYPVATNVLSGFKSVQEEKHELMFSFAASKFETYTKALIPSCVPYLFTGLKIAAPMSITASILVDTLQGDGGLGCMLSQSLKHAMSVYVFWQIVLVSAILGIACFYLIDYIEKLVLPNTRQARKKRRSA